ncbi:MAG: DUF1415 domain-containing protein [Lautropia sp.]|nr:DUF1415 domain-containing protein [Lautropia sp.]
MPEPSALSDCSSRHEGTPSPARHDAIIQRTQIWLDKAVIGLNLCPFANAVVKKRRLHIEVSDATDPVALLDDLRTEIRRLLQTPDSELETTLLVCPWVLADFLDFNDFLDMVDALLSDLNLHGTLQVASFHPHYRFAGTHATDIDNATNQSPWPTLHLLRESSIDRATAAWGPDTDRIFENNIARLRALGTDGWRQLRKLWQPIHDQD